MRDLLRGLLDLVLPPLCAACARGLEEAGPLCPRCARALPWLERPPTAPAPLAALSCAVAYRGEVERWIHRFKYPERGLAGLDPAPRAVAEALVRRAAARAPAPAPQLVVPVPLHPRRLRRRGFNPAGLLARAVGRELGAPVDSVALRRLRDTPSQTGLDRRARRRNVRGAFAARHAVPGLVWLVDDVATTGSTLAECARSLRRAGARRVVGVCAAFTPGD
jgi:ComF family protein